MHGKWLLFPSCLKGKIRYFFHDINPYSRTLLSFEFKSIKKISYIKVTHKHCFRLLLYEGLSVALSTLLIIPNLCPTCGRGHTYLLELYIRSFTKTTCTLLKHSWEVMQHPCTVLTSLHRISTFKPLKFLEG